jgi:hypothetical protein
VDSVMAPWTKTTIDFCSDLVISKGLPGDVDSLFDRAGGRGCAAGVERRGCSWIALITRCFRNCKGSSSAVIFDYLDMFCDHKVSKRPTAQRDH